MSLASLGLEGLEVQVPRAKRGVAQVKQCGEWGVLPTVGDWLGKTPVKADENVGRMVIIQKSSISF
jgi:hypothetical protein